MNISNYNEKLNNKAIAKYELKQKYRNLHKNNIPHRVYSRSLPTVVTGTSRTHSTPPSSLLNDAESLQSRLLPSQSTWHGSSKINGKIGVFHFKL